MEQLTPTMSEVELGWIVCALIGIVIATGLSVGWVVDTWYAHQHTQRLRRCAGFLLLTVSIGLGMALLANICAGIVSATLPPAGGQVSPQAFAIAMLIIVGQLFMVLSLIGVAIFWRRLEMLNRAIHEGREKDLGS